MYNEQFFQLFEATASDGELTPQEQEVLLRSAEAMGIDGEKFAIYFEARMAERFERLKHQPGGEEQILAIVQRFEKDMATLTNNAPSAGPQPPAEAGPAQHEAIGKCPACKETINGLNHVCPSCGLVIDADHDTHGSLEEMLEDQEQLLLQAKALARNKAAQSDLGLSYLTLPFIMICIGAWYCRAEIENVSLLVCWVIWLGAFIIYRMQRSRYKARMLASPAGQSLPELQEQFEKNDRQISLFFGDDAKVGQVLQTLRQQMAAAATTLRAKQKLSVGHTLVRLALFVPVIIAFSGPDHIAGEFKGETAASFPDERPRLIKRLLNEQNIPEARALLAQLPDTSAARPALLEALYESSQNHRLDSLRSLMPERQYAVVRRGLINLWWNTAATTDTAARPAFEERKRRLNAELPAKYRLDEGWLTATGTRQ